MAAGKPRLGAHFEYDYAGQLVEASYDDPLMGTHRYAYDGLQNLVGKAVTRGGNPKPAITTYVFDESLTGSPQRLARLDQGAQRSLFAYDNAGQLAQYRGHDLSYDAAGNLIRAKAADGTTIEHHYDESGRRRITVVRDRDRNVLQSERLISDGFSIRNGEEIWQVGSPLDGAEVRRSPGLEVDLFLLDELESYVAARERGETTLKQPLPAEYMDLNNDGSADFNPADLAVAWEGLPEELGLGERGPRVGGPRTLVRYVHSDHLGTTTHITDGLGNLDTHQRFRPYGELEQRLGMQPLRGFAGQRNDLLDVGLVHMGAREYAPELGRWLTPDRYLGESPSKLVASLLEANLYAYARNNPMLWVDSSGEQAVPVEGGRLSVDERLRLSGAGALANSNERVSRRAAANAERLTAAVAPAALPGAPYAVSVMGLSGWAAYSTMSSATLFAGGLAGGFNLYSQYKQHGTDWARYSIAAFAGETALGMVGGSLTRLVLTRYPLAWSMPWREKGMNFGMQQLVLLPSMFVLGMGRAGLRGSDPLEGANAFVLSSLGKGAKSVPLQLLFNTPLGQRLGGRGGLGYQVLSKGMNLTLDYYALRSLDLSGTKPPEGASSSGGEATPSHVRAR